MAKRAKPQRKTPAKLDPDDWLNTGPEDAPVADDSDDGEPASGTAGMLVNKSKLGLIFGISQSALDKMLANGAPFVSKGTRKEGWRINTAAFAAWYRQDGINSVVPEDPNRLTFDEAKAKKTQAEYERIEMANAQRRRELITIDEAVALYRNEASIIRSHLMAIPGRLAIPCGAESNPSRIEDMMLDEINIALSNISGDNSEAYEGERATDSDDDA